MTLAFALGGCATLHRLTHGAPAPDASPAAESSAPGAPASAPPAAGASGSGSGDEVPPRVIEPAVERRTVTVPKIRSQDFEFGVFGGTLNIEDFGAHPVYGVQLGYHMTEDFFLQAEAGLSHAGRTSFEVLSNVALLSASERRYKYYDLSLGYNVLPGEVFLGRSHAMPSSFYVLGGVGATDFGGSSHFTGNFGAGYKILPTDWMAVHVAVEDHVFNTDLLGVRKLDSNLEAQLGVSVFF